MDGEAFNVGGRAEHRNIDIVRLLGATLDRRFAGDPRLRERFTGCPAARGERCEELVEHVRDRPGHDRRYAIDSSWMVLGFGRAETLESGVAHTVDWYLGNEEWWRGVMDGSYRDWIASHYGTESAHGAK